MSILIACKRDDTVYMGTDTKLVINNISRNELCESGYKIQKLDNGILLGITGEPIERQTIFAYSEIFTLDKNGELTKKHIVKEIVPRLMAVLKDEGLLIEKQGELPYMQAVILIAYKGILYEICSSFCIIRYEDFQVLGFAEGYCLSTIANIREGDDVNACILKALNIAQRHCLKVGAPFLLIDTKEMKYNLVGGN